MTINIVHLYPKEMNIYGDNGNILVIKKRLQWRGIKTNIINVGVGDKIPLDASIILGGGGQDSGQSIIADDLKIKSKTIFSMANNGIPMLMICGMYQMFGHFFKTADGSIIPGIGVLDVSTTAGSGRIIGNIATRGDYGKLVGYENHSGLTTLGPQAKPIGITKLGQGNNGLDKQEGAVQNNVFGSYLHGPVLAKSPVFADALIKKAIYISGQQLILEPLAIDDLSIRSAHIAESRKR